MKSQKNSFNLKIGENITTIDLDRLAKAVIIHCDDIYYATMVSRQIAEVLLSAKCHNNPDLFEIRPEGKGGLIKVEQVRDLRIELQKSPYSSGRKVAIIYDADRLGTASSNALLKILEEPPMDSSIFLVTARYFRLLPTVMSRCGLIRLSNDPDMITNQRLSQWLDEISDWIKSLIHGHLTLETGIIHCYPIIDRLEEVLDSITKEFIEEDIFYDGDRAMDDYLKISQTRIFAALETRLSEIFYAIGDDKLLIIFTKIIESLENAASAIEMNCSISVALESVLLLCLKYLSEVEYDKCEVSRNSPDVA
ncbi:MAG: hypothetical protein LBI37_01235 [Puniceicoccales bacterium]|jgi:DNA polymerase III delta prime subunit|nr:hypothetical protein [Puniceicoccales bacterium]